MLERARTKAGGDGIPQDLKDLIRGQAGEPGRTLQELADTMIIARWLSARTAGDLGKGT